MGKLPGDSQVLRDLVRLGTEPLTSGHELKAEKLSIAYSIPKSALRSFARGDFCRVRAIGRLAVRTFPGGRSSVGRAPPLQGGGRRFDPDRLHHLETACYWYEGL